MTRTAPSAYLSTKADGILGQMLVGPDECGEAIDRMLKTRCQRNLALLVALVMWRMPSKNHCALLIKALALRADNPHTPAPRATNDETEDVER